MRRERATAAALPVLAAAVILAGCASAFGLARPHQAPPPPPADPAVTAATELANRLEGVQRLAEGPPAMQAAILAGAKARFTESPTSVADELEYALMLAAPGHPGFDPAHAEELLRGLLASPAGLAPSQRALAWLMLGSVKRQLDLTAENQRLASEAEHNDRARIAEAGERDAEIAANARLKKELEKTRAKLAAIANIERSLNRGKQATQGQTP
ncbi:MAG: hypothetical protein ACREU3_15690 [Steroidobacteraceae bacterium]